MAHIIRISLSDNEKARLEWLGARWNLIGAGGLPNIEEVAAVIIHQQLLAIEQKVSEEEDRGRRKH